MSQKKVNDKVKPDDRLYTNSGTHYKQDIKYRFDSKSNYMSPYLGDKYDFYEQIQLAKTTVDLDMIIKRAKAGDTSVLNVRVANYGDVSAMPDNINDLHELEESIGKSFNSMDPNIRALFGDSLDSFSTAVANGSYVQIINNYYASLNVNKENKEGESNV